MNGMTTVQLLRNVGLAGVAGGVGSVVINTWRRDSNRAKALLGYTAISGLCGVGIGYAVATAKRQNAYHHGLFVGGNYFVLSGSFLVFRDSIISTFGDGGRELLVNQNDDSTIHVLLARQPVPLMFASSAAGAATGFLFSLFFWRGLMPVALYSVQGIGIAALGQFVYDRFRIWRLEKTIEYHYPELTRNKLDKNADSEEIHWVKRWQKILGGRSYSSQLNDDIRLSKIQLELLEEEEKQLLSKYEERRNDTR